MRNRIARLHIFHYLQHSGKRLNDRFNRVYNPFNRLVRRIKDIMKTTEFETALIMVLIPLSIGLLLWALQSTDQIVQIGLLVVGIGLFSSSIYLWRKVQLQIEKEESEERERRAREKGNMQTIALEITGLRQDIGSLLTYLRNEKTKGTKGKTAKTKPRNK